MAATLPDLTGGEITGVSVERMPPVRRQVSDTADLALVRAGMELARVTGAGITHWELTLPHRRGGTQTIRDDSDDLEPPTALTCLLPAITRGRDLLCVTTLRTDVDRHVMHDASGLPVAELVDIRICVLDGLTITARFRRAELVSLGAGAPHIASLLHQIGATDDSGPGDVVRALGPRATAPPDLPPPTPTSPSRPAIDAVATHLRRHVGALLLADIGLRRHERGQIRRARVALRRVRSTLRTFAPLLETEELVGLRADLADIARALGNVRDVDVIVARVRRAADQLADSADPEAATWVAAQLSADQISSWGEIDQLIASQRYLNLIDDLVALARRPPASAASATPAGQALPRLAGASWRRLERDAQRLDDAVSPDADYHRVRILAKRARYACETCIDVVGERAVDLALALADLQQLLGEHQDATVTADALAALGRRSDLPPATAFTLGLLCASERAAARQARARVAETWSATSRPALRRWLS